MNNWNDEVREPKTEVGGEDCEYGCKGAGKHTHSDIVTESNTSKNESREK